MVSVLALYSDDPSSNTDEANMILKIKPPLKEADIFCNSIAKASQQVFN